MPIDDAGVCTALNVPCTGIAESHQQSGLSAASHSLHGFKKRCIGAEKFADQHIWCMPHLAMHQFITFRGLAQQVQAGRWQLGTLGVSAP